MAATRVPLFDNYLTHAAVQQNIARKFRTFAVPPAS